MIHGDAYEDNMVQVTTQDSLRFLDFHQADAKCEP